MIPEISDYEVRRELIRAQRTEGIRRLDQLVLAYYHRRYAARRPAMGYAVAQLPIPKNWTAM